MVYRVFAEKKKELANEAKALLSDARTLLGIKGLTDVRIINRYDAENIDAELFEYAKKTVFSEPQLDIVSDDIDTDGAAVFAVEYLPGQFDQRADSAARQARQNRIPQNLLKPAVRRCRRATLRRKESCKGCSEMRRQAD